MIYIVEGADGSGKTTLAQQLAMATDAPYYKPSTAGYQNETRLITKGGGFAVVDFMKQVGIIDVIIDRCYPSEWVYSKLFDRPVDEQAIGMLDSIYASLGATIVLCERDTYSDHQEPDIKTEELEKAKLLYREFITMTRCNVVVAPVIGNKVGLSVYGRLNNVLNRISAYGYAHA